jgi:hypothetical protein
LLFEPSVGVRDAILANIEFFSDFFKQLIVLGTVRMEVSQLCVSVLIAMDDIGSSTEDGQLQPLSELFAVDVRRPRSRSLDLLLRQAEPFTEDLDEGFAETMGGEFTVFPCWAILFSPIDGGKHPKVLLPVAVEEV